MAVERERRTQQQTRRARADTDRAAGSPDPAVPTGPAPAAPHALLGDPRLRGRGNAPVQIALLQEMQRSAGNRAVQRLLHAPPAAATAARPAGSLPLQRDPVPDIAAEPYSQMYGWRIGADLLTQMHDVYLPLETPGAAWRGDGGTRFIIGAMTPIAGPGANLWAQLTATLGRDQAAEAILRGRDGTPAYSGTLTYTPAVALELRRLYSSRLRAAFVRMLPGYLAARNQAYQQVHHTPDPTAKADAVPEPPADAVAAASPLDRFVFAALCAGTVSFDPATYQAAHADEKAPPPARPLRHITFEFLAKPGTWGWGRVTAPADATRAELAAELYGDPDQAADITPAAPFFGFRSDRLRDVHLARWLQLGGTPPGGVTVDPATGSVTRTPPPDPLAEAQQGPLADQVALTQAQGYQATGATQNEILDTLESTMLALQNAQDDATQAELPGRNALGVARDRLRARFNTLKASTDPATGAAWDAQATGQHFLVEHAARGLHLAAAQYHQVAGLNLPDYVLQPARELGALYLDAAVAGEFLTSGTEKLAAADARSKTYPLDVMEATLRYLRSILEPASTNTNALYGVGRDAAADAAAREEELRLDLVRARELLADDPGKAAALIKSLQQKVEMLQGEAGALANMAQADALWRQLEDHLSTLGSQSGKNDEYGRAISRLGQWHLAWNQIRDLNKQGKRAEARAALQALRSDAGDFGDEIRTIARMYKRREEAEAMSRVALGIMAMLGIGLLTGGLGDLVAGELLATGWSTAGAYVVGYAAGAAITTSLQTAVQIVLGDDVTVQGVALSFAANLTMMGVSKGIRAGYGAVLGERFLESAGGATAEWSTQLAAMALGSLGQVAAEKKLRGQDVTWADVRSAVYQAAVMHIAGTISARVTGLWLADARGGTLEELAQIFGQVDAKRAGTRARAERVQATRDIREVSGLIDADRDTILAEQHGLHEIWQARAKSGASTAELDALSAQVAQGQRLYNVATRQSLMLGLRQEGLGVMSAPGDRILTLQADFARLGDEVRLRAPGHPEEPWVLEVKPAAGSGVEPFVIRSRHAGTPDAVSGLGAEVARPPQVKEPAPAGGAPPTAVPGDPYADAYSALRANYKGKEPFTTDAAQALRRGAVPPALAERLLARGFSPDDLRGWAESADGTRALEVIDRLVANRSITPKVAAEIAQEAGNLGVLAQVHDLLPNLENPQALRQQLKDIAVEMRNNKLGKLQELNDAAARALRQDPGKQVRLGGQGDVVDPTASEVVQHKNQTTADPRNVTRELQKAARQLAGGGGEHPPADYTRLIEITLRYEGNGPRNPLLGAGPEEIQPFLRQALHDYPNMADRVRFSNERGSWTFDGPDWTPSTEPNSPGRPGRPEQVDPRLSVPESTEDGKHETFETPEGFKICSDECQLMRDRYETVLKGRRDLKAKLTRFEKMPEKTDAQVAAKEAAREQIYEELKAARLEKTMQEIDARFRAEIDNAPAAKKDDVRFKRYLEKAKERVKAKVLDKGDVLTRAEWDVALKLIRANARRGSAEERASLKDLGIENNNMPARGEPLTLNTELGERIPDGVTDRFFVDVKALEDGVFYYTEQLRAFRRAGATGRPDGIRRELAVVLTGKRAFNADGTPKVRPSEPLAADALVLHRNSQTQEWMLWDPQAHGGQGNWAAVTQDNVRQYLGGSPP